MFKKLKLENFRTHINSEIELNDVTLIIGANNSGKSNFLSGLHYFSKLVSLYYPKRISDYDEYVLRPSNYYPNKHSLSDKKTPITFNCVWEKENNIINYNISIFPDSADESIILCNEILVFNETKFKSGFEKKTSKLRLRKIIDETKSVENKNIIELFFKELASFHYYNFQPTFLKGLGVPLEYSYGHLKPQKKTDYIRDKRENNKNPFIPAELGKEGSNLQELLRYVKEYEGETYNRFLGYLKRFVNNFNGLIIKDDEIKWQFDMGGSNFPFFSPDKISDGMVKAAAVALLCSLKNKPSIILLEEVENGINQKKISEFLNWLRTTSDNSRNTQFIITSHSSSVIREFNDSLSSVYNIHLRKKDYKSIFTNLNNAIKPLVNMGTISEIDRVKKNGKEEIIISKNQLVELFFNGILGEL